MKSPPVNSFLTSDLGLASYFKCQGHILRGLEPSNGDGEHFDFIFDLPDTEGERLAERYYNKDGTTDARTFFEEMGVLKRQLFRLKQRTSCVLAAGAILSEARNGRK